MEYGYFTDRVGRSHTELFRALKDFLIDEDSVYVDDEIERVEFKKLLAKLQDDDLLVVQTVVELADSIEELEGIIEQLQEKNITIYSCEEHFLTGDDFARHFKESINLICRYRTQKSSAYIAAHDEGRVGRPKKSKAVASAIQMHKDGYSVEMSALANKISRSTVYRALREEGG
ncbi:MAG: recombinase family protein [Clostridia bacterium]|nr:recombinase family protein [Clostridia bacterium]